VTRGDPSIVCFGDSITHGYMVTDQDSFPSRLAALLGVRVMNRGIDGDTTEGALARLDRDVLRVRPDAVLVEFGANDLLVGVSADRFRANLDTMVRAIQGGGAVAVLLSLGSCAAWDDRFETAVAATAGDRDCPILTGLLRDIAGRPGLVFDGVHPTAEGYRIIAGRVAGFFRQDPRLRRLLNPGLAGAILESEIDNVSGG
jgi:acyl-CoA thioesterase-1